MTKDGAGFSFPERYRTLQPTAERAIVSAREAAHKKLQAQVTRSTSKIVDLVYLAFGMPIPDGKSLVWLEEAVKEQDPQFSLAMDGREAQIIDTLLLADRIASGNQGTPALVLVGSFGGRRSTVDGGRMVASAQKALAWMGRSRGLAFEKRLAAPGWRDVTKVVSETAAGTPASFLAAVEAVATEAKATEARLVTEFNRALDALTNENRRLAEEVDLLWWHTGRRSYLLDRPMSEIDECMLPFVVGTDVAAMINVLPGPHGALGIIHQSLGPGAVVKQSIKASLEGFTHEDRIRMLEGVPTPVPPVASLSLGLHLFADEAMARATPAVFEKRTSVSMEAELSRFDIAVQAFYERMFIKVGWF